MQANINWSKHACEKTRKCYGQNDRTTDRSRISGKEVHIYIYKGVMVHFTNFYLIFLKYPMIMK